MPDTGWHRTSDIPVPLPNGGGLQPLRDAGTTSPFCETGSVPIGTPDCATQATLIGIIKPKIVCASMLNQPMGKNSKSHATALAFSIPIRGGRVFVIIGKPLLKHRNSCLQIVASLGHRPCYDRIGEVRGIMVAGAPLLIFDVSLQRHGRATKAR